MEAWSQRGIPLQDMTSLPSDKVADLKDWSGAFSLTWPPFLAAMTQKRDVTSGYLQRVHEMA